MHGRPSAQATAPSRGTPPTGREAALRLLPSPAPIRVRLGRAGLEAFRHDEAWHDVSAWSGPERLAPKWWTAGATTASAGPHDYYSARTADGALWLLFRAGPAHEWFVEGWWD
jgi:hypothetical protein